LKIVPRDLSAIDRSPQPGGAASEDSQQKGEKDEEEHSAAAVGIISFLMMSLRGLGIRERSNIDPRPSLRISSTPRTGGERP